MRGKALSISTFFTPFAKDFYDRPCCCGGCKSTWLLRPEQTGKIHETSMSKKVKQKSKSDATKREEFLSKAAQSFVCKLDLDTASYFNLQRQLCTDEERERKENHQVTSTCEKRKDRNSYDGTSCPYCGCLGVPDNIRVRVISAKKLKKRSRKGDKKQTTNWNECSTVDSKRGDCDVGKGIRVVPTEPRSHRDDSGTRKLTKINKKVNLNALNSKTGPVIEVFCKRCKKSAHEKCFAPHKLRGVQRSLPKATELSNTADFDYPTDSLGMLFKTPQHKKFKNEMIHKSEQSDISVPVSTDNTERHGEANLPGSLSKSAKKRVRSKGKVNFATKIRKLISEDSNKSTSTNLMSFLSSV